MRMVRLVALGAILGAAALQLAAQAPAFTGPVELRVDNLKTPLGIDDPAPRFSWQLQDPARGAKQTAYEVLVATRLARIVRRSNSRACWVVTCLKVSRS